MLTQAEALTFAQEWVAAWNAHDLDRILSHYAADAEMTSPFIGAVMPEPSGTLKGQAALRAYWSQALKRFPDLSFKIIEVLAGVESLVICYHSVQGRRAAEVLWFDEGGKVTRGVAHYT